MMDGHRTMTEAPRYQPGDRCLDTRAVYRNSPGWTDPYKVTEDSRRRRTPAHPTTTSPSGPSGRAM